MKLYVVFGQRKQRYEGQFGLEAIACMTEHDWEENPEYLPGVIEENRATGEFEGICLATLDFPEAAIRKLLSPNNEPIPAKVLP